MLPSLTNLGKHRLCAISLFLENCGKTQTKRGNVTVTVTALPLVARVLEDERKERPLISLFARLPTPSLLAARGITAPMSRSQSLSHACFAFFPTDFRGRETACSLGETMRSEILIHKILITRSVKFPPVYNFFRSVS